MTLPLHLGGEYLRCALFRAVVQNHRQTVDAELDRDVAIHRVTTADPRAMQTRHQHCIHCYPPQG
ncbi:hypothetical protein ACW9HH_14985 [Nocardia gipuzkoensis]